MKVHSNWHGVALRVSPSHKLPLPTKWNTTKCKDSNNDSLFAMDKMHTTSPCPSSCMLSLSVTSHASECATTTTTSRISTISTVAFWSYLVCNDLWICVKIILHLYSRSSTPVKPKNQGQVIETIFNPCHEDWHLRTLAPS